MLFYFLEPFEDVNEGFLTSDVVSEENTMCTSIEDAGDRTEGLLAGGVPNLKLDYLIFNARDESSEFYTNGHLVLNFELIVHDSCKQTTLTDT